MQLQKRLSRIYKGKKYYKYLVVLPEKEVKKAGFKEKDKLDVQTKKGEIKIRIF